MCVALPSSVDRAKETLFFVSQEPDDAFNHVTRVLNTSTKHIAGLVTLVRITMSVSLSSPVKPGSSHLQLLLLHQLYKPYISGRIIQRFDNNDLTTK